MSKWLLERRLSQNASRLASLREELSQIDEQLTVVADEAADHELRALVSETPLASRDAGEARKHADALNERKRISLRQCAFIDEDPFCTINNFPRG